MKFALLTAGISAAVAADTNSLIQVVAEKSTRSGWTTVVQANSAGTAFSTDVGQAAFNEKFAACPAVRYFRNGAVSSVYVRTSAIPGGFDARTLFTNTWSSSNNIRGTDFEIYSNEQAARDQTGAWTYCNYDDPGVGYPRDCGPTGAIGHTWFGPTRGPSLTANNYFQIWEGADCPAIAYDEAFGTVAAGDPHCRNVIGEKFDIHATGSLTFAKVPMSALTKSAADFMVIGEVTHATDDECGPTYITAVEVLFRGHSALKIGVSDEQVPTIDASILSEFEMKENANRLIYKQGNLTISAYDKASHATMGSHLLKVKMNEYKVTVAQREEESVRYLDLKVSGLKQSGSSSGGLLGRDSHKSEEILSKKCVQTKSRRASEKGSIALSL